MDHSLLSRRLAQFDGIQGVSLGGEPEIFRCVDSSIGVMERAGCDLGGALTEGFPGPCTVDRFAVDLQPGPDLMKHLLYFIRNGAVRARTDIHQQIPVLAYDIDQLIDDELG